MEARILTKGELDEIEKYLRGKIEKDKKLICFNKIIFLHTVAHEMGHLRTATDKKFYFSYIRVNRYICYLDKDLQLQKNHLTCKEYRKIRKANGISNLFKGALNGISNLFKGALNGISNLFKGALNGISNLFKGALNGISNLFKGAPNGQCVVFTSDPTSKDYIAVLNAGPIATTDFRENLKNEVGCLEMKRFDLQCYLANPEYDAADGSPEKRAYESRANKIGSDQNLIEKIDKNQNHHENLNSQFEAVHLYMTRKKDSLPNKRCYIFMRAVADVIREKNR